MNRGIIVVINPMKILSRSIRRVFNPSCAMRIEKFMVMVLLLVSATQSSHSQTLAQALNATNLTWTTSGTSGASGWTVQNSTTHDGLLAAQSGTLLNNFGQTSILQTITNGPATMTFWWYCPSFDRVLSVFVNNVNIWGISANSGWESQTVYLGSGSQTVKWVFSFVTSGFGTPRGFVDEVVFTPGATAPIINTQPLSQSQVQGLNATFSATVVGTPPLMYQWQFNGTNILGATNALFTVTDVQTDKLGSYAVEVTNIAGVTVSSNATLGLGNVTAWGWGYSGQTSVAYGAKNVIGVAASFYNGMALKTDGQLLAWGDNGSGQLNFPSDLTNAVTISMSTHCLALKPDGTVVAWGAGNFGQTNVPSGLSNVVALAAGDTHSLALRSDGTVVAWGYNVAGQTNVPPGLSNVVAISAANQLSVVLKSDGTVVAWGANSSGQTNVPVSATNIVAIATGFSRCLAVRSEGTIVAWGSGSPGNLTTPPSHLTNVVAVASGVSHNTILRTDGTVFVWGQNQFGQTNVPSGLTNVNAISTGYYHSVAMVGSGPPVTSALMSDPIVSTNGFSVSVPSQSGRVYRLEYKSVLADAEWTPLPLVAGNGTNLVLTDPTAASSQRFYRVRRW